MKNLRLLGVLFLMTGITLTTVSCSDDDDNGGVPGGDHLQAKVDGNNFSSFIDPMYTLTAGYVNISGSDANGNSIQIQIPNFNGTGTYNSGNNDVLGGYVNYTKLNPFIAYTSIRGVGQVIVTSYSDTEIEGTFTATAYENVENPTNRVEITEGSFRAKKFN